MFEYLTGTLKAKTPLKDVVEVNGIGYKVLIPLNTFSELPEIDNPITLYTSFIVREDSNTLFGFLTQDSRDLFEKLIAVSGIGPKSGLALIGHLDLADFHSAIASSNVRLISKTPGIGKKTAERLIIEMKDKVPNKNISSPITNMHGNTLLSDAVGALIHLGYSPIHSQRAVQKAIDENNQEKDLGTLISLSLTKL